MRLCVKSDGSIKKKVAGAAGRSRDRSQRASSDPQLKEVYACQDRDELVREHIHAGLCSTDDKNMAVFTKREERLKKFWTGISLLSVLNCHNIDYQAIELVII